MNISEFKEIGVNKNVVEVIFNEKPIEIKQYLNIEDKDDLVNMVVSAYIDSSYNPVIKDLYFVYTITKFYTDISFPKRIVEIEENGEVKKEKFDNVSLVYNICVSSGLFDAILASIPEGELADINSFILEKIEQTKELSFIINKFAEGINEFLANGIESLNNLDPKKLKHFGDLFKKFN